jgi:hypothetical protein
MSLPTPFQPLSKNIYKPHVKMRGNGGVEGDPNVEIVIKGSKTTQKKVGKTVKRSYLTICITVHSGEPEINRTSATALGAILLDASLHYSSN